MVQRVVSPQFGVVGLPLSLTFFIVYALLTILNVYHLFVVRTLEGFRGYFILLFYMCLRDVGFIARILIATGAASTVNWELASLVLFHSGYFLIVTSFSSFFWAWFIMVGKHVGTDTALSNGLRVLDPAGPQKWLYRFTRAVQFTGFILGVVGTLQYGAVDKSADPQPEDYLPSIHMRVAGASMFLAVVAVLQPLATVPVVWAIRKSRALLPPAIYSKYLHGGYIGYTLYLLMAVRVCCVLAQVMDTASNEISQGAQYGFTLGLELPVVCLMLLPYTVRVFEPEGTKRIGIIHRICTKLHWAGHYLRCFAQPPEADDDVPAVTAGGGSAATAGASSSSEPAPLEADVVSVRAAADAASGSARA